MKVKELGEVVTRSWVLAFETGDEVISGLLSFAAVHGITAAQLTGIGALRLVTISYFDPQHRAYEETTLDEQVELLSLAGNITRYEGEPRVHAHVVVGRRDGTTRGGHLVRAQVRPTLEVLVSAWPVDLRRAQDPATGLALIDLD